MRSLFRIVRSLFRIMRSHLFTKKCLLILVFSMKKTGWYKLLDTLIWWQTARAYPFKTTLQPEMLKTRQLVVG